MSNEEGIPHSVVMAIKAATIEQCAKLVRDAYNEGFSEGMREHTSHKGGKTWQESSACAALAGGSKQEAR